MRVLIAEDDPSTRHLLRRLLGEWGAGVVVAADADEAWEVLHDAHPPEVAILDRGLAKGGGLGLCRLMRDLPLRAHTHVIVSMTVVDGPGIMAAFDAGADDLVAKPFDFDELRQRILQGCAELQTRKGAANPAATPASESGRGSTAGLGAGNPRAERQHAALASLTAGALAATRLGDFAGDAAQIVRETLAADRVQIFQLGADGSSLTVRARAGLPSVGAPLPAEVNYLGRCLGNEICAPIGSSAHPFGGLKVEIEKTRRFLPIEIEFATAVANLIGMVARREQLESHVEQAQKMELFGRMAGGIAHDFNNVLAVIGTSAATMEVGLPRSSQLREDLGLVLKGVERGRGLAHRLLSFSRTPEAEPGVLDFNQLVAETRGMIERVLPGQLTLAAELAAEPLRVRADRGALEQVLMNLVINARDATSAGVVRIVTAAARPGNVGAGPAYAALSVIDSGAGMDSATKARMFEPFFTTKPAGHGTGLGLATVKEIVRRAEGCIEVESSPGCGTRITVYWPRVEGAGSADVHSAA